MRSAHAAVALAVLAAAPFGAAGAASAAAPRVLASFDARSYRPGRTALLRIEDPRRRPLELQVFAAGAEAAPDSVSAGHDSVVTGVPVGPARALPAVRRETVRVGVGDWPSGVYVARLVAPGVEHYAPFVVAPRRLGESPVLVVEPTNTWQAYDFERGDSWYLAPAVHSVDLRRPYLGDGLPPHFLDYDLGFLRWYWRSGFRADFVSDDDLEGVANAAELRRRYRLVVFPGHEEYVTPHVYGLIEGFRDRGGNLAFLSADSFFYRVTRSGHDLIGRTRWRDLGRPEAALIGAEYVGWNERRFPNRPYRIVDTGAAPWLFAGTGLHDGSRLGRYGIEIDERTAASPRGTRVLAEIPDEFGAGRPAEMTIYRRGAATVFDAGVMNFGASADWPQVARLVANLWRRLS